MQEDDDVSTVLKGVSSASLEALNFVDYLNQKYDAFMTCRGCLNFRCPPRSCSFQPKNHSSWTVH